MLMAGTSVEGRHVKPRRAKRDSKGRGGATTWWRVEVTEGRTHEVRELFFRAGHPVQRLRRTAIGPLRDDSLKPGDFRTLSDREIEALRQATTRAKKKSGSRPKKPGRPAAARAQKTPPRRRKRQR
jgi:16S rRNA U516 pseudouridylate synthase RsuA-like enzyme